MSDDNERLRALPTLANSVGSATVQILRDALARAEAGETVGVLVIEELPTTYISTYSPSMDRVRRIGLLTILLSEVVSARGER